MRTTAAAAILLLVPAAAPAAPAVPALGGPAGFTVKATAVACTLEDRTATVRLSWSLEITDSACGWVSATLPALPLASTGKAAEARLFLDGTEVPGRIEEVEGKLRFGMHHADPRLGNELGKAKVVRLELVLTTSVSGDGAFSFPLATPRALWREGKGPATSGPVTVEVEDRRDENLVSLSGRWRKAAPGSRVEVRAVDGGASLSLKAPALK